MNQTMTIAIVMTKTVIAKRAIATATTMAVIATTMNKKRKWL